MTFFHFVGQPELSYILLGRQIYHFDVPTWSNVYGEQVWVYELRGLNNCFVFVELLQ